MAGGAREWVTEWLLAQRDGPPLAAPEAGPLPPGRDVAAAQAAWLRLVGGVAGLPAPLKARLALGALERAVHPGAVGQAGAAVDWRGVRVVVDQLRKLRRERGAAGGAAGGPEWEALEPAPALLDQLLRRKGKGKNGFDPDAALGLVREYTAEALARQPPPFLDTLPPEAAQELFRVPAVPEEEGAPAPDPGAPSPPRLDLTGPEPGAPKAEAEARAAEAGGEDVAGRFAMEVDDALQGLRDNARKLHRGEDPLEAARDIARAAGPSDRAAPAPRGRASPPPRKPSMMSRQAGAHKVTWDDGEELDELPEPSPAKPKAKPQAGPAASPGRGPGRSPRKARTPTKSPVRQTPLVKPKVGGGKRQNKRWTEQEAKLLEELVEAHGKKWALIHKLGYDTWRTNNRSQVDIKDKFRNLQKAKAKKAGK